MKYKTPVMGLTVLLLTFMLTALAKENALVVTQEVRIDEETTNWRNQMTDSEHVPCHYRFKDTVARKLSGHTRLPFSTLYCFDLKAMHFPNSGVRFDERKKVWVKDFSELSFANNSELLEILDKASRIYTIEAKNSTGYVYTEDELMGKESRHHRILHFCLLHSPIALCGQTDVMLLNEPENDRQPYIMEVLRSIEFIDDAASEQAEKPS